MPFTDAVSNISGRNSRSSDVSAMTGASRSNRGAPPQGVPPSDDMFFNAAVMGMLKTSTDTGDIGALSFNHARMPTMPRSAHQRRGHVKRPSGPANHPSGAGSSHHYAPSQASKISDSTSFARRGSMTSMQSMPPAMTYNSSLQVPPPTFDRARDSRSYSLTSAPAGPPLSRYRSSTSLKSAGHQPRHGRYLHPGQGPPMPDNRPPYVYPTRLKRPGYRSPSPALNELSGTSMPLPPAHAHQVPPIPHAGKRMQRPQPYSYNSDYDTRNNCGPDVHQFNVRPPPRTMTTSPPMGYEQGPHAYANRPVRPDPANYMHPMAHTARQPSSRTNQPPMPRQAQHGGQYYGPPRPGYPAHSQMQYGGHPNAGMRWPPPSAAAAPAAINMFHKAARMARHLPRRIDTPLTEGSPPSSEPPSSGTAPTGSDPPTPKDQSFVQVAVDPLFIDPAFSDLQDSSSEPVMSAKYFAYADGLDPTTEESDIDVPHPSVPPTGFVQRVRAMLESKAAVEAANKDLEREKAAHHRASIAQDLDVSELHELAADHTPRFTVIEEFEAPVELPASPVKVDPPVPSGQRLTREFVKAQLAPSDTLHDSCTQIDSTTTTDNVLRGDHSPGLSTHTGASPESKSEGSLKSTEKIQGRHSHSASASESSVGVTGISGLNYALRFSTPVDTMVSDETQSKDLFVLDADTITLQHQRSREKVISPHQQDGEALDERQETPAAAEPPVSEQPVSPLLPGENVTRCSAVSPLQTRTMGIGATLGLGTSTVQEATTTMTDRTIPGSFPEDSQPPPTPRTPRRYSKSVQLRGTNGVTSTPSSHRLSLPPDFNTMGETTATTDSEMITDIAVRFSMPTTTITIGKPQIITIPPSSSPEQPEPHLPRTKSHRLDPRSAKRNSVTFADQVAPLNISKPRNGQSSGLVTETNTNKALSILRRTLPLADVSNATHTSQDSTTDLRFPQGNALHGRFGSTHLPGLKEESVEDMSVHAKQKQSTVSSEHYQFPFPARIAAVKAMQERRLNESGEKSKARRDSRHHNRPLAETRDLPSLNFSRMDLIDKLNEALETRPSRSMELVRRRDLTGIYCPSPQRPQSTEPLRERYASFFCKPEDFSLFEVLADGDDKDSEADDEHPVPFVEIQESTKVEEEAGMASRPLLPEDLLSVATQVNRLSIPSVTGLSERLTSLLPSLRTLHLDSVIWTDQDVEHTIEDIHHLGHGGEGRRDTILSSRTSAGFRTLAERAEEIVVNGTHDSIIVPQRLLLTDKELPSLPDLASADKGSAINTIEGKQSYLSGSVSAPSGLWKDLPRPPSALTRQKSPTNEDEVRDLLPLEMNPITRSKRSLIISSASRPWNQDENYPWAGTAAVPIDLTIPPEAHTRDSTIAELRRASKSLDITMSGGDPTDTTKGIDIGSITTNLDRTASITTQQATGISPKHHRKHSKRSIIGSLSRKMGLSGRHHGEDNTRTGPVSLCKSDDSLPHRSGDRYPTSALTPPVAFNLDEVRSFFSDNSSERRRNASLRKRITGGMRGRGGKGKNSHPCLCTSRGASLDLNTTYDAGSINAADPAADRAVSSAQTFDGGVGMGKAEFRVKRFGEKLRHLFVRSGELFRSFSGRSKPPKPERVREDWLSDSLYSGV